MSATGDQHSIRDSFRSYYRSFESALQNVASRSNGDPSLEPIILAGLGDQLDEFVRLLQQVSPQMIWLNASLFDRLFSIPMFLSKRNST